MAVLDDLQVEKAPEQPAERGKHQHAGDQQATAEAKAFALGVLELGRREGAMAALVEQASHDRVESR